MFTKPGPCRLHKGFPTSDALVILDSVVTLQVSHQRRPLDELLIALGTVEIPLARVDLFMVGSHVRDPESFPTAIFSAGEALLSSVLGHVPLEVILVRAFLSTFRAHVDVVAVVLVVPVVLQRLNCEEAVSALVAVVVLLP